MESLYKMDIDTKYKNNYRFSPAKWKWQILENKQYLKVKETSNCGEDKVEKQYELVDESRKEYKPIIDNPGIRETQLIGIVRRLSKKMHLSISSRENKYRIVPETPIIDEVNEENNYPVEIEYAILNQRAVAAVDASVEEHYIAAFWIITTLENQV